MSETIRRRSLPDSLRYLAEKLDTDTLSAAEQAGVVVSLRTLADEMDPPKVPCECTDSARSRIGYCPMPYEQDHGLCPKQKPTA